MRVNVLAKLLKIVLKSSFNNESFKIYFFEDYMSALLHTFLSIGRNTKILFADSDIPLNDAKKGIVIYDFIKENSKDSFALMIIILILLKQK